MLVSDLGLPRRCADPFLNPTTGIESAFRKSRQPRPESLQRVMDAMGTFLLSSSAATMARFEGAAVVHLLQKRGAAPGRTGGANTSFLLRAECAQAIERLASTSDDGQLLAHGLNDLLDDLVWYRGRSGPYASANFEREHAHAILAGPGGIEERSDLRIGLTVMGPYTRFPDHEQTDSRVVLALSEGEFQSDGSCWFRERIGSSLFFPPGRLFAMRCTESPLLTLWCQRLRA
ncbi:dimethylsulfonioproprionate lyase family protein [Rhizobium pisi]|uniref:dimethylsulfonioproprionate lyase family protein n=1 Tax=Rhizobium pisi TaxID=574561 RepID=UPI003D01B1D9